jgi:hypothetical protein
MVLIFKAREHIGHKDASITLSPPPSAGSVPGSYDDPLSQVKLPKMSQGGRAHPYGAAWRTGSLAGAEENEPHGHLLFLGATIRGSKLSVKPDRWFAYAWRP